jgi:hypothetical protein
LLHRCNDSVGIGAVVAKKGSGGFSKRQKFGSGTLTTNTARGTTVSSSFKSGSTRITTSYLPGGSIRQTRTTTAPGFGTKREVTTLNKKPRIRKAKPLRFRRARRSKQSFSPLTFLAFLVILAMVIFSSGLQN